MHPTLVFDVVGTLLDLRALDALFADALGDAGARVVWFRQLIELVLVTLVTAEERSFDDLAVDAFAMIAARRGGTLDELSALRLRAALRTLPAHRDARPALERLRDAGFALHALSNGGQTALEEQLDGCGLRPYFRTVQSSELSGSYKPDQQVYRNALAFIDAAPARTLLVTAHPWDAAGAMRMGMQAALIARDGEIPIPSLPRPRLTAPDLGTLADRLVFFPVTSASRA